MQKLLEHKLAREFCPIVLEIADKSTLHRGHAEAQRHGGGHFDVLLVSKKFIGVPYLERHRHVYTTLGREMEGGIHALSLKLYSPQEWRLKNENTS